MPCFDPQGAADDEHNSRLAEAVCELFKTLSDAEISALALRSPKLAAWWESHKQRDQNYDEWMRGWSKRRMAR